MGLCSRYDLSFLWNTVTMEKFLVVENPRLGVLHRVLLIGAVITAVTNLFINQPYYHIFHPDALGLEMWGVEAPSLQPGTCTDATLTDFAYQHSQDFVYQPQRCSTLPIGESFRKVAGTLDFATFASDMHVRREKRGRGLPNDFGRMHRPGR
jgi:hypothetical protein